MACQVLKKRDIAKTRLTLHSPHVRVVSISKTCPTTGNGIQEPCLCFLIKTTLIDLDKDVHIYFEHVGCDSGTTKKITLHDSSQGHFE